MLTNGVLLRIARRLCEEDFHLQLFLHVVAPGDHPGAERYEHTEQKHADQDRHHRGERRRRVRGNRRPCLSEQESDPSHFLVAPQLRRNAWHSMKHGLVDAGSTDYLIAILRALRPCPTSPPAARP